MVKTCQGCPDRMVKVEDGKVITCKSTCRVYKIQKLKEQLKNRKKVKENRIVSGYAEQIQKSKGRKRRRYGHQNDNLS